MKEFLEIYLREKQFDCCHLANKYLREVVGLDTRFDEVSRNYDIRMEEQYICEGLVANGMIELPLGSEFHQGDVIVYAADFGRFCVATCVDGVTALVMKRKSMLTHIERIENKKHHFRHMSLIAKEGGSND